MNSNNIDLAYSPQSPDPQLTLLSRPSMASLDEQQQPPEMDTTTQQGTDEMQLSSTALKSSESSDSIGSRTAEEKVEDELFDKIEDLLGHAMHDPSSHHQACRVFQWPLPVNPSRVLTAVIVISPAIAKN